KLRHASARIFSKEFYSITSTVPGITCRGENHICTFTDLRQRDLFSYTRIVPGRVSNAHVILNDLNVGIGCFRPSPVPAFESMNQAYVHAADEAQLAGL